MTNPDTIVRVRARNGGRASVLEANAWCQTLNTGLLEGNGVIQNTSADMNVLVGGSTAKPDVIIAQNPAGYKVALDIVGQQAVAITAPATNSRISAIVAYTDDLSLTSEDTTVTGSPSSCGLIVVNGTTSANPVAPSDSDIRSAITADGATGSQACYAIIAMIEVAATTTTITDSLITISDATSKIITADNIDFTTYSASEAVMVGTWVDGRPIWRKTLVGNLSGSTNSISVDIGETNATLIKAEGAVTAENGASRVMPTIILDGSAINTFFFLSQITFNASGIVGFSYGDW